MLLTVQLVEDAARHVLQSADPSTGGVFKRRRVLFRLEGNLLHQIARGEVQVVASRTRRASSNIRTSKPTLAGVSVRVPSKTIVVIVCSVAASAAAAKRIRGDGLGARESLGGVVVVIVRRARGGWVRARGCRRRCVSSKTTTTSAIPILWTGAKRRSAAIIITRRRSRRATARVATATKVSRINVRFLSGVSVQRHVATRTPAGIHRNAL